MITATSTSTHSEADETQPDSVTVLPVEPNAESDEDSLTVMKKIELIDKVVEMSGIKKKFAKPVIEAALSVLGEALNDGRSLNLQPLGKVMPRKSKDLQNGTVINARIRQSLKKSEDVKAALEEDAG